MPGLSVVLLTHTGIKGSAGLLRSLALQDLDRRLFEIVVVTAEKDPDTTATIRRLLDEYAGLTIRAIRTNAPLECRLGAASARHAFQICLTNESRVSPHFLSAMLSKAKPDTIVYCPTVDSGPNRVGPSTQDSAIENADAVRDLLGKTVDPHNVPSAFDQNSPRVIATDLAQTLSFEQTAHTAKGTLDWAILAASHSLSVTLPERLETTSNRPTTQLGAPSPRPTRAFASDQIRLISELKDVARYDPSLARSLAQNSVVRLGQYLRAYPADRQEVLMQLLDADCPDLPYHLMTDAPARTLATLYSFPPTNDSSAFVAARRLLGWGELFDIVSNDLSGRKSLDPSSIRIVQGLQRNQHVTSSTGAPSRWPAIRNYVTEGISKVEEWQDEYGRYERLYSRAKLLGGLFLAALVKIRNPEIHWIAEFSDPLLYNIEGKMMNVRMPEDDLRSEYSAAISRAGLPLPRSDRLYEWAEHLVYCLADEVLYTNEAQRAYMIGYTEYPELRERAEERARVEPHPTLPEAFYRLEPSDYPLDPGLVHVGYFGRFYVSRGLTEIVAAIESLALGTREQIRLHVFVPDPDEVAAEVAEAGLADIIIANSYVPYLQFLSTTTKFDCLLVNDAATDGTHEVNPYLPSKYADYRGSGQPIWAVVEPGSPLSRLDVEYQSTLGDAAGAASVLLELVRKKADAKRVPQ